MEDLKWHYGDDRIYIEGKDGKTLAEALMEDVGGDTVNIRHVEVAKELGGQGLAGKLVQAAVERIRSRGRRVSATCPYARNWLAKHRI